MSALVVGRIFLKIHQEHSARLLEVMVFQDRFIFFFRSLNMHVSAVRDTEACIGQFYSRHTHTCFTYDAQLRQFFFTYGPMTQYIIAHRHYKNILQSCRQRSVIVTCFTFRFQTNIKRIKFHFFKQKTLELSSNILQYLILKIEQLPL